MQSLLHVGVHISLPIICYLFQLVYWSKKAKKIKLKQEFHQYGDVPLCQYTVASFMSEIFYSRLTSRLHKGELAHWSERRAYFIKTQMDINWFGKLTAIYLVECRKSIYFGSPMIPPNPLAFKIIASPIISSFRTLSVPAFNMISS